MATDLFGKEYLSITDYARRVVGKGYSRCFYKILIDHKTKNLFDEGYSISYENSSIEKYNKVSIDEPGLYAIYRKIDDNMECLYVGQSSYSMAYRVYRFIKELDGNSRKDESHPAGKKARKYGVKSSDDLYVITLPFYEFPKMDLMKRFDMDKLDEAVAHLLKAKFNKKKIR